MQGRVVLEHDLKTDDWAAWCPELPGCTSAGLTEEEALASVKEAIQLYLEPDDIQLDPGAIIRQIAV